MIKARTRRERCAQVFNWLAEEFTLPPNAEFVWMETIEWKKDGGEHTLGCVTESKGKILVMVSASGCRTRSLAIETLIHEAAHAKLWDSGLGLLHGDAYWKVAGRMYDAYEHHGHMDSQSYPNE